MSAYHSIITATESSASIENKTKLFMNIELLKELCKIIITVFEITQKELNTKKFKFLNRLSSKVDEDYLKECSESEKEKHREKFAEYLKNLSTFINEKIFKKSLDDK